MDFGDRLRATRELLGYSRRELSELAGVSQTAIYYIETGGRKRPQECTLRRIIGVIPFNTAVVYFPKGSPKKVEVGEDWLREQYLDGGLTTLQIASSLGCSKSTVLARLREYGIERRPRFGRNGANLPLDKYPCLKREVGLQGRVVLDDPKVQVGLSQKVYFTLACRLAGNTLEDTAVLSSSQFGEPKVSREMIRQRQDKGLKYLEDYLTNRNDI